MKNLLHLFLSYMRLAIISMFLAAIVFTLYAGYKTDRQSLFEVAVGAIGALLAFYIVMVFLSLKPSDLWRSNRRLLVRTQGSSRMQMVPGVNSPVSNVTGRTIVAIFVLVCHGVTLITFAKSRGWPIQLAVTSFSTVTGLWLAVVFGGVLSKKLAR